MEQENVNLTQQQPGTGADHPAQETNSVLPAGNTAANENLSQDQAPQQELAQATESTVGAVGAERVEAGEETAPQRSPKSQKVPKRKESKPAFAVIQVDGKTIEIDPVRNNVAATFDGPEYEYLLKIYNQRKAAGLSKSFNQYLRQTVYAGNTGCKIGHTVPHVPFKNLKNQ